ncbi:inositol-pentakisphosphate 2-kinase [Zygosaccharomyces mellis]|uniref:Inositol-pentakisphosphate 2-kinase n=1 Tax=Zygosaccharomyces mellis TaxID=42258 RepID=A0A4C2EDJ0_9SACH|nr:inositol-pentakisphosphate 2-kinase [Zygosaccharomyces mellis]
MKVIAEGGANILIDYGDPGWLYRICKKFPESLKKCNQYTSENCQFINEEIKPFLGDLLCPMELKSIPLHRIKLIKHYFVNLDDNEAKLLKIKQLKGDSFRETLFHDHFTSIYRSSTGGILMEMKPKWLFSLLGYCRNCTHNIVKGRKINYCYKVLLTNAQHFRDIASNCNCLPMEFVEDMIQYFGESDNVLKILHDAQKELEAQQSDSVSFKEVSEKLLCCMTLRDVTCFLEWRPDLPIKVSVVDVDLKLKEKWAHWLKTHKELENCQSKVFH